MNLHYDVEHRFIHNVINPRHLVVVRILMTTKYENWEEQAHSSYFSCRICFD